MGAFEDAFYNSDKGRPTAFGYAMSPIALGAGSAISNAVKKGNSWKKSQDDMLSASLSQLQHDPGSLGMSDAERQKMIGDATSAANAQQQGQVQQLNQGALAGQGFQAGAFQQASQDIAKHAGDAGVQAAAGVNALQAQLVNQEKQRILSSLDERRARAAENQKFWLQFGLSSAGSAITAITNPAGPLASAAGGVAAAAPTAVP